MPHPPRSLADVLAWLKIEQAEDWRQYQQDMIVTPLHERKKKGLTWYPVQVKDISVSTNDSYSIIFEKRNPSIEASHFQVGDAVAIFCNEGQTKNTPRLHGIITALWKTQMRISLQAEELPDWIEENHVGIDLLFDNYSYQVMETAMHKVMQAHNDNLATLRDTLLGKVSTQKLVADNQVFTPSPLLNNSQNEAVKNILASQDIALVHGPPGTGKTTTLVEAIRQTLWQEKQVLVTAPSNTAVDWLVLKLAAQGIKVIRIGNPARIEEGLLDYSLDAQITQQKEYRDLKNMYKKAEEMRRLAKQYKRSFGSAEREQRKLLWQEAKNLLKEAEDIEKHLIQKLLYEAQVICATLVGTMHKYLKDKTFSTVFIDEAGQALEPATWIPITKAQKVVLAGDHCQLPPTVKSWEATKKGLGISLFEQAISHQPQAAYMLKVQYRMHQDIMQFSNEQFYNNQLSAHESVAHRLLAPQITHDLYKPFQWIDTAGCGFEEVQAGESLYNAGEVSVLIQHLTMLLESWQEQYPQTLQPNTQIAVISPYKAQVKHLEEIIKENSLLKNFAKYLKINTIDSFQGQECEVVYISLVRSNEAGQIGFLQDTRRMNVALTRAKHKVVVIGDSATTASHPFYSALLSYAEKLNAYHTAWEFTTF